MNQCRVLCVMVLMVGMSSGAWAEIPQVISYQGKVTDTSGNAVADGNYAMRFRIYDAVSGGTLKWDSGAQWVAVTDGAVGVLLGESPQPAITLDFSQDYWLAVAFAGVDQTPRQRMASVGYSYMASGLAPGTVIAGAISGGNVLEVKNQGDDGIAIRASANSSSGNPHSGTAVYATTNGDQPAIEGHAETDLPGGIGVYGLSWSAIGVMGVTTDMMGVGYGPDVGVWGEATTMGPSGSRGVYGKGQVHGGYFEGQYVGVQGTAWSTEAGSSTYGGEFITLTTDGAGVFGEAQNTSGASFGVFGRSWSTAGVGVYGHVLTTAGFTKGVQGVASSQSGIGVGGYATDTSGNGYAYGMYGESDSPWDGAGVYGLAAATSMGHATYGVRGQTASTTGYGVYGEAVGAGWNYGVFSYGNFGATGTKAAVVKTTTHDWVHLYAMESPDVLFEDVGTAELVNGQAMVAIDPVFAETVNLDESYQVFLTPRGDCGVYLAETSPALFKVRALHGETPTMSFDYRIVAKRRGYENVRLAPARDPELNGRSPGKEQQETDAERDRMSQERERMESAAALVRPEQTLGLSTTP